MTLVKDENMQDKMIPEYSRLILKSSPWFIEVKGYVSVGYARKRLGYDKMPTFEEVESFSEKLAKATGYKKEDYSKTSKVVLLKENHSIKRFIS